MIKVKDAPIVWNYLNGVINVFKPAGVSVKHARNSILGNLCKDLNSLETRPPRQRIAITDTDNDKYDVSVTTDWSDHVLAVGPRYQISDFKLNSSHLGRLTSGVLLVGLNAGTQQLQRIRNNRLLRVYHVTGVLGTSTENNFKESMIIAKANYTHIWPVKISGVLSSMQASHQKKMFEMCGVDIQSEAAFEIAKRGLIRPVNNSLPVVYGIKCVRFDRPEFVVEIHSINENEKYLGQLIQEIGLQLHSVAYCTGIRCIRHGHFTVEDSLLRSSWNLQTVLSNIKLCGEIIDKNPNLIHQTSIELANQ